MRVRRVRISGFKAIPFAARLYDSQVNAERKQSLRIEWERNAFDVCLPVNAGSPGRLLSTIIGANSTGKSSILHALAATFGSVAKLDPDLFHQRDVSRPVLVELTLLGEIENPEQWHHMYYTEVEQGVYCVTAVHIWQNERRARYIRRVDGRYYKLGLRDRARLEELQPAFRFVDAQLDPASEAELDGNSLIRDLVDRIIDQTGEDSAIARMEVLLAELRRLATRPSTKAQGGGWEDLATLEEKLSAHVASVTPSRHQVRISVAGQIPSIRELFARGQVAIDNGIALGVRQHGMGMQRALIVSALRTWCEYISEEGQDYLFVLEEPEIFLHPHSTRVLMRLLEQISLHHQVLFTSHSSEFVNRVALENTIIVHQARRHDQSETRVTQPSLDHLDANSLSKVQRYLREDRSDMLFARSVLLVEGQAELFALPAFARTIGLDLDYCGCSVVYVNGIGNFATYHEILAAFQIPHVILVDGDGRKRERERVFAGMADAVHVLERDFETELVAALCDERLLELMNECLRRRDRPMRVGLGSRTKRVKELTALGKPLVGRVAGELLTPVEVRRMTSIASAIRSLVLASDGQV